MCCTSNESRVLRSVSSRCQVVCTASQSIGYRIRSTDSTNQAGRGQGGTSSSARRVASSRSARFTGSDLFTGFRHSVADMLTVIASTPTQSASVQSLPVLEARSRAFARRSSAARDSAGLVVRCCFDPVDGFIREKEAVRS